MSEICAEIHRLLNNLPIKTFPFDPSQMPKNGLYILFETGELAHGLNRIVRVGTHTGKDQLRSRLRQHFINENKDRSIFRKNIGRALLNKANDPYLEFWELDLTTKLARDKFSHRVDKNKQDSIEKGVSKYIQSHFSFVTFEVEDKAKRLEWESKIISTVSSCKECNPSKDWLGHYSPKEKIKTGGLWLVNELYKAPLTPLDLILLAQIAK